MSFFFFTITDDERIQQDNWQWGWYTLVEYTYRSNLQAYAFGGLAFVRDDSQQESCMLDSWRGQMGRLQWSAVDTL